MTAIGSGSSSYAASYDASGNMLCRAPTSSAPCVGTPTGAQLSYDNEGRLAGWQNAPGSSPTNLSSDLYDGEGNRVEQQIPSCGVGTSTVYVGSLEEVSTTLSASTTTTYYSTGDQRILRRGVEWWALPCTSGGIRHAKEGNAMFNRSSTYRRAVSFKWLVGLIFILGALYALFVNHVGLLDAALLFGIGAILV